VVISIVSLFGILVFGSNLILKSLSLRDFSFLTAATTTKVPSQGLFIEPPINFVIESPEITFIQSNSIVGVSPPMTISPQVLGSVLGGVGEEAARRGTIVEYIVESGDTLSSIAAKFSVSLETILWANDLTNKSIIKIGQKLIISPVSGVIYHVKNGDILGEIAKTYKGEIEEIIIINELSNAGDIFIGDILIIPGGEMPPLPEKTYYATPQVPLGSSSFFCPTSNCKISQWLHWYNAIDFVGKCGDPIYAAAGGIVQKVKYGWNGGAGNYVRVLHPNGVVTGYGHISTSLVSVGQKVSQGEMVALIGGKPGTSGAGISTGCHVHFSVHGARNPFAW